MFRIRQEVAIAWLKTLICYLTASVFLKEIRLERSKGKVETGESFRFNLFLKNISTSPLVQSSVWRLCVTLSTWRGEEQLDYRKIKGWGRCFTNRVLQQSSKKSSKFLRFWNEEVMSDPGKVLRRIGDFLKWLKIVHLPLWEERFLTSLACALCSRLQPHPSSNLQSEDPASPLHMERGKELFD